MNAQDNRDALPTMQGDNRRNTDSVGRRTLHQDEGVLQPACVQNKRSRAHRAKTKTIKWNEWNPFERVTGDALRQLNKRQRKQSPIDCVEEAPF